MKRRRGFTKVELIIAMVLVTLAGLGVRLFLAVMRADPTPRSVTCTYQLKQIAYGMMQYIQENDERYPPAKLSSVKPISTKARDKYRSFGWADAANNYIRDK